MTENNKITQNNSDEKTTTDKVIGDFAIGNQQEKTIGKILREKRLEMKIDMADAALYLKVKLHDIDALENDEWQKITRHLYTLGLIRSYANFLKIDHSIIEEKIKLLTVESNVANKKHQLVNIGENIELSPSKDSFFNFLLISILLFLVLLSFYNFRENNSTEITSKNLMEELEKTDM